MGLLRILLAASIVFAHSGNVFFDVRPKFAVPAFFIISGFVIALVLNEKYTGKVWSFYLARYLRLWPSYIVVLLVTLAIFTDINPIADSPIANLHLFGASYGLLFFDTLGWVGYDDKLHTMVFMTGGAGLSDENSLVWRTPMAHMWSVGVEMSFYLVAPLMARRPKILAAVFIAAFVAHVWITLNLIPTHPLRTKSAVNSFYLFVAGMLAYWGWVHSRQWLERFSLPSAPLAIGTFLVAIWMGLVLDRINPLLSDMALLATALALIPLFHFSKVSKIDRAIGELSYAVYLVHFPLVLYVFNGHYHDKWWGTYLLAVSIMLAIVLQYVVVRPLERVRRHLASSSSKQVLSVALATPMPAPAASRTMQ
jgi:peptidoglycan/LPS O-acetylase OafA/YrhL